MYIYTYYICVVYQHYKSFLGGNINIKQHQENNIVYYSIEYTIVYYTILYYTVYCIVYILEYGILYYLVAKL